jgi:hypothetical protein
MIRAGISITQFDARSAMFAAILIDRFKAPELGMNFRKFGRLLKVGGWGRENHNIHNLLRLSRYNPQKTAVFGVMVRP